MTSFPALPRSSAMAGPSTWSRYFLHQKLFIQVLSGRGATVWFFSAHLSCPNLFLNPYNLFNLFYYQFNKIKAAKYCWELNHLYSSSKFSFVQLYMSMDELCRVTSIFWLIKNKTNVPGSKKLPNDSVHETHLWQDYPHLRNAVCRLLINIFFI